MSETMGSRVPGWYWAVAVLAALWMAFGVFAWSMDLRMDAAQLASLSDAQRELFAMRPQWVFVVYGIAVFSGLVGAVGLLMRRKWAIPAFWISLIAVVVQFGYTFLVMDALTRLGPAQALPLPLAIVVVDAVLLWFAIGSARRGWIR